MTSMPQNRPPAPSGGRPAAGGPAPGPTIDPVKLVLRYKWVLAASVFVGVAFGLLLNIVLGRLTPVYVSEMLFQASEQQQNIGEFSVGGDPDELNRFMNTQVGTVLSPGFLEKVARDPRITSQARAWSERFQTSTGFDYIEARLELEDVVSAGVLLDTNFFRISVRDRSANEAYALAQIVQSVYADDVQGRSEADYRARTTQLRAQVTQLQDDIADLQSQKQQKIKDEGLDTLKAETAQVSIELRAVKAELLTKQLEIAATSERVTKMRSALDDPQAGIRYSDELIQIVESSPIIQRMKNELDQFETEKQTLINQGIQPGHRAYRLVSDRIEAMKGQLEQRRQQEMRKGYNAQVDALSSLLGGLRAEEADLLTKSSSMETRLTDLQSTLTEIAEIDAKLEALRDERSQRSTELSQLEGLITLKLSSRVKLFQAARKPDERAFPRPIPMVIVGVLSVCGLSGVFVVAREVLDQRVKGPSDVALIPRARVLGMLPLAAEDPDNPKRIETIFRDAPQGVMAESVRQVRNGVLRRMAAAGHKTLMIVPGMPGSGATSVATNLAFAMAAGDKRVLLIDTNFRRPGLHTVFGVEEAPGLAGVLAGTVALGEAIRTTDTPGVDLLTVGAKESRVFEQLSSRAMAELLETLKQRYDVVLLDTAPAVVSGDSTALANLCDASLLVVRAMSEKRGMVARLRNELDDAQADLLGVLVNAVRASAGGYMRKNIRTTFEYQAGGKPARSGVDAEPVPPKGGETRAA